MTTSPTSSEAVKVSIRKVVLMSWLLVACMTLAGWLSFSPLVAKSLFVGGLLVNVSFLLLNRDLVSVLSGELKGAKPRFLIKYYARLVCLALVLYILLKFVPLSVPAFLVGLSAVMVSIIIAMSLEARKFVGKRKEA